MFLVLSKKGITMIEVSQTVSETLRKQRAILFLTREELSKEIGLTAVTLRKIERGGTKVNSKTYEKIMLWLVKRLD